MKKITKSADEWRSTLSPEEYRVTREKGTEAPFTGEYYQTKEAGVYKCVCCGEVLFDSEGKYDSGCGWPSFWRAADDNTIEEHADHSLMMSRTEIVCAKCDAHLGHVFNDGPAPSGQRYCVNSASLSFASSQEKMPEDND